MRVLVTGASGRIGSALAGYLKSQGHWVRGFDLVKPSDQLDDSIAGSLNDNDALEQALDGVEAVAHLAALMAWHPKDLTRLFEINVTGTFQLLSAAKGRGLKRFAFASSGEVYPELNPRSLPITEDHPTLPTSPYGMTKLLGETLVRNLGAQYDIPYVILRFSHTQTADELLDPNGPVSGPRFHINAKIRQLQGMPQTEPVQKTIAALQAVATVPEQHYISLNQSGEPFMMGVCDVRDLCKWIALGLTRDAAVGETFNIGGLHSFKFDEAIRYMARVTGLPVREVRLFTTDYRYETSIQKAVDVLGYTPEYDIFKMIDDAATRRPAPSV
ncbi:MAG: NAD(P)-dependent oxidoreductase [Chloroflexi bacterium]|nr:UDP-glucose 4-epimerase [Anaerolineae bacterium]RIK21416.1 MAG: NAD(P)-dependent oxidoreductase [Chloroflexota bacterium]